VTDEPQTQEATETTDDAPAKDAPYHVSDLTDGQVPDPLGDSSLSADERARATSDG
jgi:hypothetical protein